MTVEHSEDSPHKSEEATDPEVLRLREGIEQQRADMSDTIDQLETRLNPGEVREKVGAELKHVEDRVREVIHEQLNEAKSLVRTELLEAKQLLRAEMNEAEEKVKRGLGEARDAVKHDVKEAFAGAKHAARAATLGKVEDLATKLGDKMNDTRDTLVDTVRHNPIPATLMGVGLVWLLMNRSRSASSNGRRSGGALDRTGSAVNGAAQKLGNAANEGLHQAVDFAENAAHGASEATLALAHRAGDAASHLAGQASGAASSIADGARKGARKVEDGFHSTLEANPVAVGAAALAVGAIVGFSLPRTRNEDALMGDARDRMMHQAGDLVHDAASSVANLAEQGVDGATKALQPDASPPAQ